MFSRNFFVAATCILLAALFFAVLYFWKKRDGSKLKPIVVGILTFFIFAVVFENIFHSVFVLLSEEAVLKIAGSLPLYLLYGCSMAGVFEETGRYFAFKNVLSDETSLQTAIGYGIGHGGVELVISGILLLLLSAPEHFSMQESVFWIAERAFALTGHIGLSVIVFTAVKKGIKALFFLAVLLHGIADIPIGLYKFGVIDHLVCCVAFAFLVLICCLVAKKCRRLAQY